MVAADEVVGQVTMADLGVPPGDPGEATVAEEAQATAMLVAAVRAEAAMAMRWNLSMSRVLSNHPCRSCHLPLAGIDC